MNKHAQPTDHRAAPMANGSLELGVLLEILYEMKAIHDHQHEIAAALTMQKERLAAEKEAAKPAPRKASA